MRKFLLSTDFDAIVIGSGIGGLTCAALLAQSGKRVCVLEQHSAVGGYAQHFARKGFVFDSSVHSVSMADNGYVCGLLTKLGIRDKLTILPNVHSASIRSPKINYTFEADLPLLTNKLCADFPSEAGVINAILDNMQMLFKQYKSAMAHAGDASPLASGGVEAATRTYGQYIESFVTDPTLRYLLGSIWPFGGSSPSFAPYYNAFIFIAHALEGSHYIVGGFNVLADALTDSITSHGGQIRTQSRVNSIRISNGRVAAVSCENGEHLSAESFVSNISPYSLHNQIIPQEHRNRLWQRRLRNLSPSVSAVCVYLGLDRPAADFAPDNVTLWFGSMDHDEIYRRIQTGRTSDMDHLLVMRPPQAHHGECMTLIHLVRPLPETDWTTEKQRIADAMLEKACSVFGDFTGNVVVRSVASPDTFERYTGNTGGALYGFENTSDLYGQSKLPFTTYLPNLFQAGHWTKAGGGIYNVMTSGEAAATFILDR
jgi:prolycopene isomerase